MSRGISYLQAPAAPLFEANIDTDIIIPSREMKTVTKTGLGAGLFANRRYTDVDARDPNPDFILNRPPFDRAEILVAGANFGCGSSREHAVWALKDYGIKAVIAPSFGSIFANNCVRNGIIPAQVPNAVAADWARALQEDPDHTQIAIDIENARLSGPRGQMETLSLAENARQMILNGWDPIDLTLQHRDAIEAFRATDAQQRPWAQLNQPR